MSSIAALDAWLWRSARSAFLRGLSVRDVSVGKSTVARINQIFENEMSERLSQLIEDPTARTVIGYQSQIMFSPDRVVEMFVFDDYACAE